MLFLLMSEEYKVWEQRAGSFHQACRYCNQPAWQLLFRIYRTLGSAMTPASPHGAPVNEVWQVRCATCGGAAMTAHPSTWVHTLGVPVNQEYGPVAWGTPQYVQMAYPGVR